MSISLSLFLNICLFLTVLFPYSLMYIKEKSVSNYGRSFISTFIFLTIYFSFTFSDFWKPFFAPVNYKDIMPIFLTSIVSISIELLIMYIKYKKIKIAKIKTNNFFILLSVLVIIPLLEEVNYIILLHTLCRYYNIPNYIFILLSGCAFGLSHIIYHPINIVTKTVWGIVFAISFIFSGNIYVPILSHILNNVFLNYSKDRVKI